MPALISRRAAEGIFDVSSPVMVCPEPYFIFYFSSKTMEHLLPTAPHSWLSWMPSCPPPDHAQCMVYMTHTGIEVIGQAGGSVAPCFSGVVRVVVAFLLEPYICLRVFFMPFSHKNANILVLGAGRLSHFVYYAGLFFFFFFFFSQNGTHIKEVDAFRKLVQHFVLSNPTYSIFSVHKRLLGVPLPQPR